MQDNPNLNNNSSLQNICPKCGNQNEIGAKFCIKCGYNFETVSNQINNNENEQNTSPFKEFNVDIQTSNNINQQSSENLTINETVGNFQQSYTNISNQNINGNTNKNSNDLFKSLVSPIVNPSSVEKSDSLNEFKNSGLLALIVSIIGTVLMLISTIISTVRVTSYSFFSESTTTWEWSNIKNVDFIKTILSSLIAYLIVIFVVAGIFYIGTLIIKKQCSFPKMLGITTLSLIPSILATSVLSPLLSIIYAPLGVIITLLGSTYTLMLFYEGINQEIKLEGNKKYYFNLGCVAVLIVLVCILLTKFMESSITGGLGNFIG